MYASSLNKYSEQIGNSEQLYDDRKVPYCQVQLYYVIDRLEFKKWIWFSNAKK